MDHLVHSELNRRFTGSFNYVFPFKPPSPLKWIVGGWQTNGIITRGGRKRPAGRREAAGLEEETLGVGAGIPAKNE